MSGFKVIKPGAFTSLQDLGRFGYQHIGLTTGGVMDEHAARWANKLLDNTPESSVLEITLGNVVLEAECDFWIAVTGADQQFTINGEAKDNWSSHYLNAGDRLAFAWSRTGLRAYLAVQGGFTATPQFGSCSTVAREGLGGLNGESLQKGDYLPCHSGRRDAFSVRRAVPPQFHPEYAAEITLGVVLGYQEYVFPQPSLETFFSTSYSIKPDSDRMGYRLNGEPVQAELEGMLSEGISFGAIQVPPDGQPIILLKDRQTLGGYPKLGALLPIDAFKLSQCRPGQTVKFIPVSVDEAQKQMKAFYQFFS